MKRQVIEQIKSLRKKYENMNAEDRKILDSVCMCIDINYIPVETIILRYHKYMKTNEIILLRTIENFVYKDKINILSIIIRNIMIRKYEIEPEIEPEIELEELEELE